MENEFEKLRVLIPILAVNTAVAKKHLPEVERCIRLIKEHRRGILISLLFKKMPQIMFIELINHVV
jgi:hypothetical protein